MRQRSSTPSTSGTDASSAEIRPLDLEEISDLPAELSWLQAYPHDQALPLPQAWGSFAAGRLRHVAVLVYQGGRTGLLFTSRPKRRDAATGLARLADHACRHVPAGAATLVQALTPPDQTPMQTALADANFHRLAGLTYMQRSLRGSRLPVTPQHEGVIESWRPELRGEFLQAIDQSYLQTMDCPDLRGLRATEDILVGHMSTGQFDPRLWLLLRIEQRPAGLLLLNPISQIQCVELVYLGLAPAYRGRSLGRALTLAGLHRCARHGHRRVTLAVDEANEPAIQLYKQLGFYPTARKVAWIRNLQVT
ncbi:MAG: GNAT family N-acetyltransferase [Phycisphaerae bacterium]|nr:GNAT family N-acetyltransferase [Phycisphaerae bacterium]